MRKTIVLLLAILLFTIFNKPSFAKEGVMNATESAKVGTSSSEYKLPHPGMLPDNPLYKIKTLRDKIMVFFIRDPMDLAEKHIQLADRQLYEALKVAEKGNIPLAVHTAFKGEHQMTLATSQIRNIETIEELSEIKEKSLSASQKHRELLAGIADRAKDDAEAAGQVEQIIQFSYQNDQSIRNAEEERIQQKMFEELLDGELESESEDEEIDDDNDDKEDIDEDIDDDKDE